MESNINKRIIGNISIEKYENDYVPEVGYLDEGHIFNTQNMGSKIRFTNVREEASGGILDLYDDIEYYIPEMFIYDNGFEKPISNFIIKTLNLLFKASIHYLHNVKFIPNCISLNKYKISILDNSICSENLDVKNIKIFSLFEAINICDLLNNIISKIKKENHMGFKYNEDNAAEYKAILSIDSCIIIKSDFFYKSVERYDGHTYGFLSANNFRNKYKLYYSILTKNYTPINFKDLKDKRIKALIGVYPLKKDPNKALNSFSNLVSGYLNKGFCLLGGLGLIDEINKDGNFVQFYYQKIIKPYFAENV